MDSKSYLKGYYEGSIITQRGLEANIQNLLEDPVGYTPEQIIEKILHSLDANAKVKEKRLKEIYEEEKE